jgi:uncharacterized membrane protein YidH (DUF202 family)
MKDTISILLILLGILGGYYSYSEFKNIDSVKNSFEYQGAQTIDNLAFNILGIERTNNYKKEIERRETQTTIIAIGSFILTVTGIIMLWKGHVIIKRN